MLTTTLLAALAAALLAAAFYFVGLRRGERLGAGRTRADLDAIARSAADRSNQLAREAYDRATGQALDSLRDATRSERAIERARLEEATRPLSESLASVRQLASSLEQRRAEDHGALQEVAKRLSTQVETVVGSTRSLREALKGDRQARGRWGEIQLQALVESVGLLEHCDFTVQTSQKNGGRPDLVLRLPGGGWLAVDSKVPMDDYLAATEADADPADQTARLTRHAERVKEHARALSRRKYPSELGDGPPFTVLFLPIESLLSEAIRHQPDLLGYAADHQVVLATPHTLMGLLWSVAAMWRSATGAKNAALMREAGRELEKRLGIFLGHLADVGNELRQATNAYNNAVGSAETRLTPQLRTLRQLDGRPEKAPKEKLPDAIDIAPRLPHGDDLGLLPERTLLS